MDDVGTLLIILLHLDTYPVQMADQSMRVSLLAGRRALFSRTSAIATADMHVYIGSDTPALDASRMTTLIVPITAWCPSRGG
jgi:hypothetical protein